MKKILNRITMVLIFMIIPLFATVDYCQNLSLNKITEIVIFQEKEIVKLNEHIKLQNQINELIIQEIGKMRSVLMNPINPGEYKNE